MGKTEGRMRACRALAVIVVSAVIIFAASTTRAEGPVDAYTGAEWDTEGQGFYYLGISGSRPLGPDLSLAGKVFAGHITYKFDGSGTQLKAKGKILTPAVGLSLTRTSYVLSGFLGPDFRKTERERADGGEDRQSETGLSVQAEYYGWAPGQRSLSLIASYSTIDDFFWARARMKRGVYDLGSGRHLLVGAEAAGMGNSDFSAFQAGALAEVLNTETNFSVLLKAGYKNASSSGGTAYTGIELYKRF